MSIAQAAQTIEPKMQNLSVYNCGASSARSSVAHWPCMAPNRNLSWPSVASLLMQMMSQSSSKVGMQPVLMIGPTSMESASREHKAGRIHKYSHHLHNNPSHLPLPQMCFKTLWKGLSAAVVPSCSGMLGPAPSSHWYSAKAQMNMTSSAETDSSSARTNSSTFSLQACDTMTLTSRGASSLRSRARPRPVPAVRGLIYSSTTW
mmetsp:Transcript_51155/g.147636  ORF Transcript_51155/g.147636 Transcript_51155/m.147636 type:complete len:204 (+) Transcript_51155:1023-1634(+)